MSNIEIRGGGEEFGPTTEGPFVYGTDIPIASLGSLDEQGIVVAIDIDELNAARHDPRMQAFFEAAVVYGQKLRDERRIVGH